MAGIGRADNTGVSGFGRTPVRDVPVHCTPEWASAPALRAWAHTEGCVAPSGSLATGRGWTSLGFPGREFLFEFLERCFRPFPGHDGDLRERFLDAPSPCLVEGALAELRRSAGSHFDPAVVEIFARVLASAPKGTVSHAA
jgi:hypothetical protein